MNSEAKNPFWRGPGLYMGLIGASVGIIAGLFASGLVQGPLVILLMIIPAGLLIPLARSGQNWEHALGMMSPALRRYNWRMMVSSIAYALGFGIAVWVKENHDPGPALTLAITLLPTLPALGMIAAMVRYMVEETDEYLRHRAAMASLIGLSLVLTLGTVWGFLETFGLVVNIWAWWVVPVWAFGLAIGQAIMSRHERKQEQDQ